MNPLGASKCGRCLDPIPADQVEQFINDDHLCQAKCAGIADSEHAQALIVAEKGTSVADVDEVAPEVTP